MSEWVLVWVFLLLLFGWGFFVVCFFGGFFVCLHASLKQGHSLFLKRISFVSPAELSRMDYIKIYIVCK